jgi:hypothetical protein
MARPSRLPPYRRDRGKPLLLVANGEPWTPVSAPRVSAAADRIKANWAALLPGQAVPLIGEGGVVDDAEPGFRY